MQAAGFCPFLCKLLLLRACCFAAETGYYVSKLAYLPKSVDRLEVSLCTFLVCQTAMRWGLHFPGWLLPIDTAHLISA